MKDGKLHGYRKLYWISPEGQKFVNIEYWQEGVLQKHVQNKW